MGVELTGRSFRPMPGAAPGQARSGNDPVSVKRFRVNAAVERTLRHLQVSDHRHEFSIRGAWCLAAWLGDLPRATRGLDLAYHGCHPDPASVFRNACPRDGPDALVWDERNVSQGGSGWTRRSRLRVGARVEDTVVPLVVDIAHNVGSPPHVERIGIVPVSSKRFLVDCLSREWLFAEKCALLVTYGPDHTRLQDLFDLREMSRRFRFDGTALCDAFRVVASGRDAERMVRRRDGYWEGSLGFHKCTADALRRWETIAGAGSWEQTATGLRQTIAEVRNFVWPVLGAVRAGVDHAAAWRPELGWRPHAAKHSSGPVQALLPFAAVSKGIQRSSRDSHGAPEKSVGVP